MGGVAAEGYRGSSKSPKNSIVAWVEKRFPTATSASLESRRLGTALRRRMRDERKGPAASATRAHLEEVLTVTAGVRQCGQDSGDPMRAPVAAIVGKLFEQDVVDPAVRHDLGA